jgi:hypothetical protein
MQPDELVDRRPVFSSTVTIASAIGPAFSASRMRRRRSTSVKPFGPNGCLATSVMCCAGFLATRSVRAAQPKNRRTAARAALTDAGL